MDGVLQALVLRMQEYDQSPDRDQRPDPLTREERKWAKQYLDTGKVPEMKSDGREPAVAGAGYLRYRKVYAGGDRLLISHEGRESAEKQFALGRHNQSKAA